MTMFYLICIYFNLLNICCFLSYGLDIDTYASGVGKGEGEYKSEHGKISISEHPHELWLH